MPLSLSRIDSVAKRMKKARFSKCINNKYNSTVYKALNARDLTVFQHQLKSVAASQKLM